MQPYGESIAMLGKLQDYNSPVEKLSCLLSAMSALKTAVVEYWRGKEELEAMDDLLPVLIFVLLRSTVLSPAAHINLLQDYIGHSSKYENEGRLLINFEVSVRYVALEWPNSG